MVASSDGGGIKQKSLKSITKISERRLVEYFVIVSSVPRKEAERAGLLREDLNAPSHLSTSATAGRKDTDSASFQVIEYTNSTEYEGSHEEGDPELVDDNDFQPVITARYPAEDHEGNPLHESVTCFCHPTGSIQLRTEPSMPKVHYFVSTGGKGQQMYGTCLTLFEPCKIISRRPVSNEDGTEDRRQRKEVFLPKCLCILSAYPYLMAFREFLTQLNRLTKMGDMPLPVERYIVNFCSEIPAPPPGSFEVQTMIMDSVIKLWSPPCNQPIAWVSLPFSHLFQCLDLDNIVAVWHALSLERQILVTSTQLSLLTTCCEIFVSLLFPMRWSHAYIPVLPHFLIPILSAPMPYLCGIDKFNLPSALFDLSRECIVVDLDMNQVTFGPMTPPLPAIPKPLNASLRAMLDKNVGMIYREARCLTKNDDYSERGVNLKPHVKEMADAAWEGRLCLFDESFQLYFTPEEARKNVLNGNDTSGMADASGNSLRFLTRKEKMANMKSQSQWDGVQEAFLSCYVSMLSNYRKFLVFPSKSNQGSYGGAGFRSKQFIQSQRRDLQPFLRQLVSAQMFDDFITKRLYGSGEADVTFFDQAIDRFLKQGGDESSRGGLGRVFRNKNAKTSSQCPLLQSARVRRKLKTIVPPEPCGADLPLPAISSEKSIVLGEALVSVSMHNDDASVGSSSTGGGSSRYSYGGEKYQKQQQPQQTEEEEHGIGNYCYTYPTFPSKLDPSLFGTPRPLHSAVLAEFDRQKEDAARFRRKTTSDADDATAMSDGMESITEKNPSHSAEVATFTLFFVSFTAVVGKELLKISENSRKTDKTILSTYQPPTKSPSKEEEKEQPIVQVSSRDCEETIDSKEEVVTFEAHKSQGKNVDEATDEIPEQVDEKEQALTKESGSNDEVNQSDKEQISEEGQTEGNDGEIKEENENEAEGGGSETEQAVESGKGRNDEINEGQEEIESTEAKETEGDEKSDVGVEDKNDVESSLQSPQNSEGDDENHDTDGTMPKKEVGFKKALKSLQVPSLKRVKSEAASNNDPTPRSHNRNQSAPDMPRNRFHDTLSNFTILEAKVTARAQLGLAFDMLDMMRQRDLKADPEAYQCLVDACGRCGDTERATQLLGRMHEDGIAADGVVYSCLVSAFSAETAWKKLGGKKTEEHLPEWANGVSVEMDWNKLQRRTYMDIARQHLNLGPRRNIPNDDSSLDGDDPNQTSAGDKKSPVASLRQRFMRGGRAQSSPAVITGSNDARNPAHKRNYSVDDPHAGQKKEMVMTKPVLMQVMLGENLLELIYPDISIDTDNELCPRCHMHLLDDDVVIGWTPCDSQDYTTTCPNCTLKFVPHFCVQSTSPSFLGSRGPASPLFCERLSPWVLQKELRNVMSDREGVENLLLPEWRAEETKNATLWWNLVLSFMRYRLPFSFLLQGSFKTSLIAPTPEDEAT